MASDAKTLFSAHDALAIPRILATIDAQAAKIAELEAERDDALRLYAKLATDAGQWKALLARAVEAMRKLIEEIENR